MLRASNQVERKVCICIRNRKEKKAENGRGRVDLVVRVSRGGGIK